MPQRGAAAAAEAEAEARRRSRSRSGGGRRAAAASDSEAQQVPGHTLQVAADQAAAGSAARWMAVLEPMTRAMLGEIVQSAQAAWKVAQAAPPQPSGADETETAVADAAAPAQLHALRCRGEPRPPTSPPPGHLLGRGPARPIARDAREPEHA